MNARVIVGAFVLLLAAQVIAQPPPPPPSYTDRFVSVSNTTPAYPYDTWANAATTIQDAVDAASAGDTIHVAEGTYESGYKEMRPGFFSRVAALVPLIIRSVSGPSSTIIRGGLGYGYGYGYSFGYGFGYGYGYFPTRCVYLDGSSVLDGFTLLGGTTLHEGDDDLDMSGGGVWVNPAWGAVITNCLILANDAEVRGGGAYFGTYLNCSIRNNSAKYGGGVSHATLHDCTIEANDASVGGGMFSSTAERCIFDSNSASFGGALSDGSATNCLIVGNSAVAGAASQSAALDFCTVVGNEGTFFVSSSTSARGCIFMNNTGGDIPPGNAMYCRLPFVAPGNTNGNISANPLFEGPLTGNYRLQAGSPCIDSVLASELPATDLVGIPRPLDGDHQGASLADMGAYEFVHPLADSDLDGMKDVDELAAGTELVNGSSYLGIEQSFQEGSVTGLVVVWQSVAGKLYSLNRTTNLVTGIPYTGIASNIAGLTGTTSYTDTTATASGPYFYCVGVMP